MEFKVWADDMTDSEKIAIHRLIQESMEWARLNKTGTISVECGGGNCLGIEVYG